MAEAIAGIGLLSSILTIIESGVKVSKTVRDLNKSEDGQTAEQSEALVVVENMEALSQSFRRLSVNSPPTRLKASLKDVLNACGAASRELQEKIASLQVDKNKSGSTIRRALKTAWNQQSLDKLDSRLVNLKTTVALTVLDLVENHTEGIKQDVERLMKSQKQFEVQHKQDLNELHDRLRESVDPLRQQADDIHASLQADLAAVGDTLSRLQELATAAEHSKLEHRVLSTLSYEEMLSRRNQIRRKHCGTFDWLLRGSDDDPTSGASSESSFQQWLKHKDGVFWITGKAGCGKSTFAKWLVDEPKVLESIRQWCPDGSSRSCRPIVISFFFWLAGSTLNQTLEGFLRSLIFEIVRQCPELAERVAGPLDSTLRQEHNTANIAQKSSLDEDLLLDIATELLRDSPSDVNYFLFVDGLDEYKGSPRTLTDILQLFATFQNVRLCLTSRPWPVFDQLFGQSPERRLTLHEHINGDIEFYIREFLEGDTLFASLVQQDRTFESIVAKIVQRANGVFLWVVLVVRVLRSMLADGNDLEELEVAIDDFPQELEPFFRRMLETIPKRYRNTSAEILLLMLNKGSCYLPFHSVLAAEIGKGHLDPLTALWRPKCWSSINKEGLLRLRSRTLDLVEPNDYLQEPRLSVAYFIHRTVRDFLFDNKTTLLVWYGKPFSPHESYCNALLGLFKVWPVINPEATYPRDLLMTLLETLLDTANDYEKTFQKPLTAILDESASILTQIEYLSERCLAYDRPLFGHDHSPLLALALRNHYVSLYVKSALQRNPMFLRSICHSDPMSITMDVYPREVRNKPFLWETLPNFTVDNYAKPLLNLGVEFQECWHAMVRDLQFKITRGSRCSMIIISSNHTLEQLFALFIRAGGSLYVEDDDEDDEDDEDVSVDDGQSSLSKNSKTIISVKDLVKSVFDNDIAERLVSLIEERERNEAEGRPSKRRRLGTSQSDPPHPAET